MVVISRCVTEVLRYVMVIHDLSRLLARSITACYILMRSVFRSVKVSYGRNVDTMQFKAFLCHLYKAVTFTNKQRIYTQWVFKQQKGINVYNVQSAWQYSCFLTSSLDCVTSRDTTLFMEV